MTYSTSTHLDQVPLTYVSHSIGFCIILSQLAKITHNSQTIFIKERYIGENIRLLFEIIDNATEDNKPGLIFFSDFENAFDSIDHTYIANCLKHFNFGEDFIKWVKLFYKDAKSCVSNNGLSCLTRCLPGLSFFHLPLHHMY